MIVIFFRLILILLPSFRIDMNDWKAWSARLVEVTPVHFYSPTYFSDYFPGYLYILWFLGFSYHLLFPQLSIFGLGFELYLKFLTNIFDLATAFYIYKIIYRYQKRGALIAVVFYLANPGLTFNSSVWGQVDGILTFFLVYSAYSLIELRKINLFILSSTISILMKPQGLAIFPILLIYYWISFKVKKFLNILFIPLLLVLLSLPFFLSDPILGLFHLFQKSTATYPYTSMFSYNFWSFAGWWISDSTKFLSLSYQIWGVILFTLSLILIFKPLLLKKNYQNRFLIYLAICLSSFAFFLFLTRIHQRYLFPFFSFLLIAASIKNSVYIKIIYAILSTVYLINLGYVYYYYNYVYANSKFVPGLIYNFLSTNYNVLTIINLIGFGLLLWLYYNFSRSNVTKSS